MSVTKSRWWAAALCTMFAVTVSGQADAKKKVVNPLRLEFLKASKAKYAELPDIAKCRAGRLADAEKQGVLDTLNDIRALHGLEPVVYDDAHDDEVMAAALMMAANNALHHNPPETWACYSGAGTLGASTSTLEMDNASPYVRAQTSADDVIEWIQDLRNIKGGVGHRIWLLNPFMKTISYGNVSGAFDDTSNVRAAVLRIFDGKPLYDFSDPEAHPFDVPRIIAYPFQDYPTRYFKDGAILSFAVVMDKNNSKNGGIDFSEASIVVTPDEGQPVDAKILAYDADFAGLPQTIQFDAGSIQPAIRYSVAVKGVKVSGQSRDFDYWFRIAPPPTPGDVAAAW